MQCRNILVQLGISTAVLVIFLFVQNGYENSIRKSLKFMQIQVNQFQEAINSNDKVDQPPKVDIELQKQDKVPNENLPSRSKSNFNPPQIFHEWHNCIMPNLTNYREENPTNNDWIWKNLPKVMQQCQGILMNDTIKVDDFRNNDETKRHILPLNEDELTTIITLGVGRDTVAEENLLKALKGPSKFYGADPIYEINAEKYNKFGTFFNFGIGAESGMFNLSVLIGRDYAIRLLPTISLVHFVKDILKINFIDDIWIDNEGAEYNLFPYFLKDGELDRNNITVCQCNLEAHSPNNEMKRKFHEFIFQTLNDKRYALLL
ncbi:hypothetical protein WR25_20454 isoform B [Diploscapter pachys]|nr:hypothetical protein WR25_20454 isoform B [Diploscapter pachys]